MTSTPSVLIPIAPGTNRNQELADAFAAAGASTTQVPLQALRDGETKLVDHQILALAGGFSYGDALGAGRLLGLDLSGWFADQLNEAVAAEMPIFGVCNGFQALVRAGFLPGDDTPAALVANDSGRFECRWVTLAPVAERRSIWLDGLTSNLRCPVAHAEGKLVADGALNVAFRYVGTDGGGAEGAGADGEIDPDYPANPNGSAGAAAGLVDDSGFVLGLMPHPEDHIHPRQDPLRGRADGGNCLPLFQAGVTAVSA